MRLMQTYYRHDKNYILIKLQSYPYEKNS